MNRFARLLTSLILLVIAGCNVRHDSPANTRTSAATSTQATSTPTLMLTTGSWSEGPEFDRIHAALDEADANIRLDVHQGIEWYDGSKKSWENVESMDAIRDRLENVAEKSLVCVATGKASWDKEAEYIQNISEFARQLEFDQVVVTVDHSSELVISQVIQLKD